MPPVLDPPAFWADGHADGAAAPAPTPAAATPTATYASLGAGYCRAADGTSRVNRCALPTPRLH
jgi:hypothetical protein